MPAAPVYPLQIFFDGACSVCAGEMEIYRRKEHAGRLHFIDISDPAFDPAPFGVSLEALMYEMHVIDRDMHVYRGVEAFWAIWQAFPASTRFGLMGGLITLPGVNYLARLTYWCFARIRRFLPKKRSACRAGTCAVGRDKSRQA